MFIFLFDVLKWDLVEGQLINGSTRPSGSHHAAGLSAILSRSALTFAR